MHMFPPIRYAPLLFALSLVIAIAVAVAALWIALQLLAESLFTAIWKRFGAALVMGGAICGMHYTGMAETWADRLAQYLELGQLASEVNAPGNDVFDSHDVEPNPHACGPRCAPSTCILTRCAPSMSDSPSKEGSR